MADEKDIIIENLRRNGAKLSLEVLGLRNFIGIAIDHVRGGGALGDSELAAIRDRCLFNVKNFDSSGMPLNQEADAIMTLNDGRQRHQPALGNVGYC
jgi:hypothetical protein